MFKKKILVAKVVCTEYAIYALCICLKKL